MVGTRTSKGGRFQGLPSVRRLADAGPLGSEDEDGSGDDEAGAGRRGRSRGRSSAARSGSHRVAVLSDRRCVCIPAGGGQLAQQLQPRRCALTV